ncbi:MAG: universal stress protein [Nitrospiraceae bacterium]|nr:universal stress protein [Nitrospiraceae bacterium]
MRGYRKVLIAVDGSLDVVKQGIRMAQDEKTWITVLKVIPANEGDLNLTGIRNIEDVLDSNAMKTLAEVRRTADEEGALIRTRLEEGEPSEKIVEVASAERCDVIILGAKKKKNWFERIFGDQVIEKVLRQAPCPVFVVGA